MTRLRNLVIAGWALAAVAVAGAEPVVAATFNITGVKTEVEVTAPLGALGLGGAPSGSATVDTSGASPVFAFPITGGTLNTASGKARIQHEGSGVSLFALADPSTSVTVGNFLIKANLSKQTGSVFGDVTGGPQNLRFFKLGSFADPLGIELLISKQLAGALTSIFGAPDLSGATFGYARPDVSVAPVPLPAGVFLMLGAFAALGAVGARRRASRA